MMNKKLTQSVRIIAGKWRRRKIYFPDLPALRPTQDRVRETAFNWLDFHLSETACLDLFSGSGVLGFECLSRGAAHVSFVDESREAVMAITENIKTLAVNDVDIHRLSIPTANFSLPKTCYDIVFLDPPFHQNLFCPAVVWLLKNNLVNEESLIYFEMELASRACLDRPAIEIIKDKSTKKIAYGLFKVRSVTEALNDFNL